MFQIHGQAATTDLILALCYSVFSHDELAVALILFWLLPRIALSQCPTGFEEVEHWCILYRPVGDTASGGNADCATRAEGGKIIDLETEEEFQAILNWLRIGK